MGGSVETDGVLWNMIEDLLGAGGVPAAGETGDTGGTETGAGGMDREEEDEIGGWV